MLCDILSNFFASSELDCDSTLAAQAIVKLSQYSPKQQLKESREIIKVKLTYNIVLEEFRQLYVQKCRDYRQRIKHFTRLRNNLYVCAVDKEVSNLLSALSREAMKSVSCN